MPHPPRGLVHRRHGRAVIVDLLPIDRHDLVLDLDRVTVGVGDKQGAWRLTCRPGRDAGEAGWTGWARGLCCCARLHADECGDRALSEATDLVRVRVRARASASARAIVGLGMGF